MPSERPEPYTRVLPDAGRRRWASGREPSLLEQVSALFHSSEHVYPIFRIRSTAIDASVLISEILACVRRGHPVALVRLAELEVLRVFAVERVIEEVDRKLALAAITVRIDPPEARAIWKSLRPHLRVVTVPEDVVHSELVQRDPSDLPTAFLSRIIGSRWTWSNDHDLCDLDLATPYSVQVALHIDDAANREQNFYAGLVVSAGVADAVIRVVGLLCREVVRRPWLGIVLGIGIGLAGERILVHQRDSTREVLRRLGEFAGVWGEAAARELERYGKLLAEIPPPPAITADLPPEIAIARVLAVSPLPLSVSEVMEALDEAGVTIPEPAVLRTLRSPIFMRTSVGRWQLGWW